MSQIYYCQNYNMPEQENITELLLEFSNGKAIAVDALLPIVYDELKRLASNYLRRERSLRGDAFSGNFGGGKGSRAKGGHARREFGGRLRRARLCRSDARF